MPSKHNFVDTSQTLCDPACAKASDFWKKERNKYEDLYNTKVREIIPVAMQRSGERSRTLRKTMIEAQEPIRSTGDTSYKQDVLEVKRVRTTPRSIVINQFFNDSV